LFGKKSSSAEGTVAGEEVADDKVYEVVDVDPSSIGSVLNKRGNFDQAFEHYQSALEIQEKEKPDSMLVSLSYNNIGALRYVEGDLPHALYHHRAALNIAGSDTRSLSD
jgi:tetratricopeptide (TPR) repeat protein